MLQKKTVKKYGFFMGLIVIANLVGFNPAFAFSDQDFAHLLGRVRALEDKVFDAQQKARIAICEKVHVHEQLVAQAIEHKQNTVSSWQKTPPSAFCTNYAVWTRTAYVDQVCLKTKETQRDQELSQRDQKVQTAENALKSAQAEAKSAGAVCN